MQILQSDSQTFQRPLQLQQPCPNLNYNQVRKVHNPHSNTRWAFMFPIVPSTFCNLIIDSGLAQLDTIMGRAELNICIINFTHLLLLRRLPVPLCGTLNPSARFNTSAEPTQTTPDLKKCTNQNRW